MREGSTLIREFVGDVSGTELEQPLALPSSSGQDTLRDMGMLFLITMGYNWTVDNVGIFVFLLIVAARWLKFGGLMLACLCLRRTVPPMVMGLLANGLLLYLSVLFTKHWIDISTATLSPQSARRVRARLRARLKVSVLLLPLTLIWGALLMFRHGAGAFRAWESFLHYGREGEQVPGVFHSPAGGAEFRRCLFFAVGTGYTLSMGAMPLPMLEMIGPKTVLLLVALMTVPVVQTVLIPALILAPALRSLNRATHLR